MTRTDGTLCSLGNARRSHQGALITLGLKAGLNIELEHAAWPRSDEIPFESRHRYMATLHHDHAGHGFVYIKGTPERILEMRHYQRQQGETQPIGKDYWQQQIELLARQGPLSLSNKCRQSKES